MIKRCDVTLEKQCLCGKRSCERCVLSTTKLTDFGCMEKETKKSQIAQTASTSNGSDKTQ